MIVALDFPSGDACFRFLDRTQAALDEPFRLRWVKVGLELFLAEGAPLLRRLRSDGYNLFLDLKLHDIPNTVARAVESVLKLEPALLTVHSLGGPAMLAAAAKSAQGSGTRLLAVTVLTSMHDGDLQAVGLERPAAKQVERLATVAVEAGLDGLVCSAQEAPALRHRWPAVHLVTPGIRPAGADAGDQQRTATPGAALAGGSSQIVVGRPITAAADPAGAVREILDEMAGALAEKR